MQGTRNACNRTNLGSVSAPILALGTHTSGLVVVGAAEWHCPTLSAHQASSALPNALAAAISNCPAVILAFIPCVMSTL